jgi:hypothetical protein
MEPESSLPHSQVPATCPYPEPTPSSPHNPLPLPDILTSRHISLENRTKEFFGIFGLTFLTYGLDRTAFEASLTPRGTCTLGLVFRVLRKWTISNTEEQVLSLMGGIKMNWTCQTSLATIVLSELNSVWLNALEVLSTCRCFINHSWKVNEVFVDLQKCRVRMWPCTGQTAWLYSFVACRSPIQQK